MYRGIRKPQARIIISIIQPILTVAFPIFQSRSRSSSRQSETETTVKVKYNYGFTKNRNRITTAY